MKPRHKRIAFIASGVLCLGVATALVLNAFQSNLVFFHSPSDVLAPNEVLCPVCKVVIRSGRELCRSRHRTTFVLERISLSHACPPNLNRGYPDSADWRNGKHRLTQRRRGAENSCLHTFCPHPSLPFIVPPLAGNPCVSCARQTDVPGCSTQRARRHSIVAASNESLSFLAVFRRFAPPEAFNSPT